MSSLVRQPRMAENVLMDPDAASAARILFRLLGVWAGARSVKYAPYALILIEQP